MSDLLSMSRRELLDTLRSGHPIEAAALDDSSYVGVSLGMPGWVDRLAWKTFMKTFHRDPDLGVLRGWNVRLQQDGIDAPPRPLERAGDRVTFGHYRVRLLVAGEAPSNVSVGLMLDYGAGGSSAWDVAGLLRDPLVALRPGDVTELLGWTYVRLLGARIPTPSFFWLRRVGVLDHCIAVPSGR